MLVIMMDLIFEFSGYHPYIDGRAEIFLKSNNKKRRYIR